MLITVGWAATLYRWRQKWQRQQQAWQWWYQQQTLQSHHTAESIRDGLLQQTFAFRRYLEMVGQSDRPHPSTPAQTAHWLERFQTFYQSLETLSDKLSPPFIADSLPHALKFTLNNWIASLAQNEALQNEAFASEQIPSEKGPAIPAIQCHLPADWPQNSSHQNQIILSITTALLTILVPKGQSVKQIDINLCHTAATNTLTLKIDSESGQAISKILELVEFQHLKEIFHSLAAGRLEISQIGNSLTGYLYWQNSSN